MTEMIQSKPYSVLLLYPEYLQQDCELENLQTYFCHVMAPDAALAVWEAQKEAAEVNNKQYAADIDMEPIYPREFVPIFACEGHVENET